MSSNQDTQAARSYHEATKLSYINLRTKPSLYKSSEGQPMVPLPQELSTPEMPTLDALSTSVEGRGASLDLAVLGRLLYYSSGLIRKATLPSAGEVHYRAAASAGALYPIEAYVVCGDLPDLPAGVYRFSPEDMGLYRVREGDHRGWLSRAMGEGDLTWEAALVFTAVFWRSAWKYRARSYRYCFWDNGTVLANLLAAGAALRVRSRVSVGFVDEDVNGLLGLTGEREAVLCVARLGSGGNSPQIWESGSEDLAQVRAESAAGGEIVYPEMRDLHAASSLGSPEDVREWQGSMEAHTIPPRGPLFPLGVSGGAGPSSAALGEVIQGRGSTRRFAREDISGAQLSALIHASTRSLPADFRGPGAESLLYVYLIVNAVEGLPAGSYVMTPERDALEVLDEGKFRSEAGHLCFEQALGADASVVVFLMADLERVMRRFGNRGYRAAQLEAGVVGGRIYLATHSLGLGATGLTFYDDEVVEFFSPHAEGKSVMFVVALGLTAAENKVRPYRSRVGVKLDALARGASGPKDL